jgi:hypothetical protein
VLSNVFPPTPFETLAAEHRREVERNLRIHDARRGPTLADRDPVIIRIDRVQDVDALARLAILNGLPSPVGDHVVAEVRGTIVAALPLNGGKTLCDWVAAAHLVPLLELRARQITGDIPRKRRVLDAWRWTRA